MGGAVLLAKEKWSNSKSYSFVIFVSLKNNVAFKITIKLVTDYY
jgi:hypothetical protein